jgi:hypothetical protein
MDEFREVKEVARPSLLRLEVSGEEYPKQSRREAEP